MSLEVLDQLALLNLPQLNSHVGATSDKVGLIAGELAVPHPLQVPLQGLMLSYGEVVILHVNLEQLDLFISRTSSQVFVVG